MSQNKESKDSIDEMLGNIERVDAPMFLLTKIQARVNEQLEASIPLKYVWTTAFSLMILLMLNVWVVQDATRVETKDNIAVMMEEMDLIPSNSFY